MIAKIRIERINGFIKPNDWVVTDYDNQVIKQVIQIANGVVTLDDNSTISIEDAGKCLAKVNCNFNGSNYRVMNNDLSVVARERTTTQNIKDNPIKIRLMEGETVVIQNKVKTKDFVRIIDLYAIEKMLEEGSIGCIKDAKGVVSEVNKNYIEVCMLDNSYKQFKRHQIAMVENNTSTFVHVRCPYCGN